MSSESIRVTIFDKVYTLKGDADTETTKMVAKYVNSKIGELQELTGLRDDTKVAVLSALNIAGELFETKAKYEAELKKVFECQDKIKALNEKIASAADK